MTKKKEEKSKNQRKTQEGEQGRSEKLKKGSVGGIQSS